MTPYMTDAWAPRPMKAWLRYPVVVSFDGKVVVEVGAGTEVELLYVGDRAKIRVQGHEFYTESDLLDTRPPPRTWLERLLGPDALG